MNLANGILLRLLHPASARYTRANLLLNLSELLAPQSDPLCALLHRGLEVSHPLPVLLLSVENGTSRIGLECDRSVELGLSAPEADRRWRRLLGATPRSLGRVTGLAGGRNDEVLAVDALLPQFL